ncbi:MAG TPA: glycosyltransferase family 4 protein [Labilithrix sp.]|nr:glycosyltransferase family 4 protein [Labilithrix sp.]
MRIGIFTSAYPGINGTGGIPVYTHSLATGLVQLGHEAHVLFHDDEGRSMTLEGVQLHGLKTRHAHVVARWLRGSRENIETSLAALRLSRKYKLDAFEFPNFDAMGVPFGALSRVAPPMVVRLHTSTKECQAIENRPLKFADHFDVWRESAQCDRAAALVVSTRAHGEHMSKELGIDADRIGLVPLGLPDIAPEHLRTPRPRHSPPTVVYVGRLEPRKGTIDLFEAVPRILARVPDARFIFCGNDRPLAPGNISHAAWLEKNLPAEARSHIELTGFVDDATRERLVADADVFCAPSLYESFGLIFLEAMRIAVPVVGTHAGGIPEVVTDGETGLLVKPQSPEEIAAAIIDLLTDEPKRLKLAAAGRRSFVEKFSNLAMAKRTVAHHEALIERRQHRANGRHVA